MRITKKAVMAGRWNYTLKCGEALRNAIHDGDPAEVLRQLQAGYQELLDAGIIDEDEFERYTEDFELYLYDGFDEDSWDDPEDIVDYELDNFYDLCDNMNVWVGGI